MIWKLNRYGKINLYSYSILQTEGCQFPFVFVPRSNPLRQTGPAAAITRGQRENLSPMHWRASPEVAQGCSGAEI